MTRIKSEGLPSGSGDDVDAKSLIGKSVICPGEVFSSPGTKFYGKVVGTPKSSKRTQRCYVEFQNDDTQYWFPSKEVAGWLVDEEASGTEGRAGRSGRGRSGKPTVSATEESSGTEAFDQATTASEYEATDADRTDAEPTDVEPTDNEAEEEKAEPGFRAGEAAVQAGADYGVPLGLTLAVLVFAGLLWFFTQLWVSERRLSKSSIPFSS